MEMTVIINRSCTNTCEHCAKENRVGDKIYLPISLHEMETILENCGDFVSKISLFGGEPTIHPNFFQLINTINKRGKSINIITNGYCFENIDTSQIFWSNVQRNDIKSLEITLSLDSFHEKFFHMRQRGDLDYYTALIENISISSNFGVRTTIILNWVFSSNTKHLPSKQLYGKIIDTLERLKSDSNIESFSFQYDPLHMEADSELYKIGKNIEIKKIPSMYPQNFNSCSPHMIALRKGNKIIYSYCIYLGDGSIFGHLGMDIKKNFDIFLSKYPLLEKICERNNIYEELISSDKQMPQILTTPQLCYKNNRACSLCKFYFTNLVLGK